MNEEARMVLDDVISFCTRDGRDSRIINILSQSEAIDLTETSLEIEVPSRFAHSYLMKNREVIESYLEEITFSPLALHAFVPEHLETATVRPTSEQPQARTQTQSYLPAQQPISAMPVASPIDTPTSNSERQVTITNRISPEEFMRLSSRIDDAPASKRVHTSSPTQSNIEAPRQPAKIDPANSRYTFDTFVYGSENKHAYQSSVTFVNDIENPVSSNFLFIYGDSGVGKTHLLLAIQNALNKEKPFMRVKYANSQQYLDEVISDMRDAGRTGKSILSEYHAADVLIIDDIQLIANKQTSVEYFFQLIDEFIREHKKVAIASDRAPKDLDMDERLTSRFNSGMLCLISSPGYEMKYAILRRYYETNILPSMLPRQMGEGEPSLMESIHCEIGELTTEHLKHMAEVSDTNIRNLESFCERCAQISWDKKQQGEELEATDIDEVARKYFDFSQKIPRVEVVQRVVGEFYSVPREELIGAKRNKNIAWARHVAIYITSEMCQKTLTETGKAFYRDHSTVMHSISKVEARIKEDRNLADDINRLKNKILLTTS